MKIEDARKAVADEADKEGRVAFAGQVRMGLMDDNPMVQKALAGDVPEANVTDMVDNVPDRVDMGEVPNISHIVFLNDIEEKQS